MFAGAGDRWSVNRVRLEVELFFILFFFKKRKEIIKSYYCLLLKAPPKLLFFRKRSHLWWKKFLLFGGYYNYMDHLNIFEYYIVVFNFFCVCEILNFCEVLFVNGNAGFAGWSSHPVCGKRYHFIIRNDSGNPAFNSQHTCIRCGSLISSSCWRWDVTLVVFHLFFYFHFHFTRFSYYFNCCFGCECLEV